MNYQGASSDSYFDFALIDKAAGELWTTVQNISTLYAKT